MAIPVSGLGAASLSFASTELEGTQQARGELNAIRIASAPAVSQATMVAGGRALHLATANYTLTGSSGVGTTPDRRNDATDFQAFSLAGKQATPDLDILVTTMAGKPAPTVRLESSTSEVARSPVSLVRETATVDAGRQVLTADVESAVQAATGSAGRLRIDGNFSLSIWSWNFTLSSDASQRDYVTGAWRTPIASDSLLGQPLVYREFAQVAVLTVSDGWVEFGQLYGSQLVAYAQVFDVEGIGSLLATSAKILPADRSGLDLDQSSLAATGEYSARFTGGATPELALRRLVGAIEIDGRPVDLGNSGPLRSSTVQRDSTGNGAWAWPLAIAAVMGFAVLAKGPALTGQFNRLQMRLERKDYLGVLGRIDRFTRRPKYARRATFLKAVSLLSLEEYREAALFLQSLAPHEGPDPATRAFLQACAAAGLGQDSTVIERLSACFKDDPSYIEEARTVPVLAGYLPYFSLADDKEAAT